VNVVGPQQPRIMSEEPVTNPRTGYPLFQTIKVPFRSLLSRGHHARATLCVVGARYPTRRARTPEKSMLPQHLAEHGTPSALPSFQRRRVSTNLSQSHQAPHTAQTQTTTHSAGGEKEERFCGRRVRAELPPPASISLATSMHATRQRRLRAVILRRDARSVAVPSAGDRNGTLIV